MRLKEHESTLFNEIQVECPRDFLNCKSHLEKLVEMQHFGIPTRLLDITRNPLVALYFATEPSDSFGEVVMLVTDQAEIKYPRSDSVSLLACIPTFSKESKDVFFQYAKDHGIRKDEFNKKNSGLLQEVKMVKPAFLDKVEKEDLCSSHFVMALKNNERIVKQDGAFIICGLVDDKNNQNNLNEFRYKCEDNGKRYILFIDKKGEIRDGLERNSINQSTLFPDIQNVSEFLKTKYEL